MTKGFLEWMRNNKTQSPPSKQKTSKKPTKPTRPYRQNCLQYALRFWEENRDCVILYNSDHVINVPIGTAVSGFLPLNYFGKEHILSSFLGLIDDQDIEILNEYFKWIEELSKLPTTLNHN